ncbi:uncharacterized protein EDB91DRAFT_1222260 [Suillus paluster]|uniref:uncharacterized protein n=1 Tax=Suillus paluster TaxID=48578 RepID=UPI001B865418|nr:uncharacterized protein EDB91DRAFT_1222260 [Suillus paluster]KAG1741418.1 hypothetical protein EDB91DRAFT_1222260 [Suillus paluster]
MEDWWRVNETYISNLGMNFAGHACVTTANAKSQLGERRNQSYHTVCNLIKQTSTSATRSNTHKNVILFGQAGSGKSSLINLMAGKDEADTSPDMKPHRAISSAEYDIEFDGESYKVFETIGLEEPQLGLPQYLETVRSACELIQNLESQGGIDLLLFCMRAGRLTATLQSNYRLFHEFLCDKQVPIVIAITHLEEEEGRLNAWWERNEEVFLEQDVRVDGHACVVAADRHDKYPLQYKESRVKIRNLVKKFTVERKSTLSRGDHFVRFMLKLKNLLLPGGVNRKHIVSYLTTRCGVPRDAAREVAEMIKNTKRKNVVLFGQTGAGKSSLINLMAGKGVAGTSNDMKGCTMRSEEYDIEFGGESYKVFDTIGLEEPQLGLTQYLEAVENAYKLIQNLERQGGIDLLLFCMRAGRLTATLQNNYWLFHEFLCEKKVPIVVAITHLEEEEGVLDAWWERNEGIFLEQGVHVAGHACIIAADRHGKYSDLYEESRVTIRNLVKKFAGGPEWTGGNNLFVSLMRKLKELLIGPVNPRKDTVPRLTKRCGMSREAATQLADMIK